MQVSQVQCTSNGSVQQQRKQVAAATAILNTTLLLHGIMIDMLGECVFY
jgi:hypothetical protein